MVCLLGAALTINYIDRGTVSIAAPVLETELHLSTTQLSFVLSAFFWTYVPSQPVMGWLADRLGAARVLAGGVALWSLATCLAGLSHGVGQLVALRLLMGIGESTFYPSALALLAQRVSDTHRVRATAIMQLGGIIGPFLGTYLGGLVMVPFGWRTMFLGMGLASLLWLIPWSWQWRGAAPLARPAQWRGGPSLGLILRQRALWGTILGNFCSNYAFYFVFLQLPLYLVHERGLSLLAMTRFQTLVYLVDAASCAAIGWLLDGWVRRGASMNLAYKSALVVSAAGVGACLIAASGADATAGGWLLLGTGLADGLTNPAVCSLTQRFAGPQACGRWMGVQNALSNTAGIFEPIITGQLVIADGGHYGVALWFTGGVALLGLVGWLLIVPRVRPVDWQGVARGTAAATA
jgi:MFS family permease